MSPAGVRPAGRPRPAQPRDRRDCPGARTETARGAADGTARSWGGTARSRPRRRSPATGAKGE
jgi:hypothetical protein